MPTPTEFAKLIPPTAHLRSASLDAFFAPKSIAVIGASDNPRSIGRTVLRNLIESGSRETNNPFASTVYPIHPLQSRVLGIKAYKTIAAVPEPIELAIIATPAATVPELVQMCADAGVQGVIIIAAGFRETGEAGAQAEETILKIARTAHMRILGPNCLGIMRPPLGLNATFAATMPRKGDIAFVSQSGALGTAVLDWSIRENFGFSAFISLGSMLDLGWGEIIDYLGTDPQTSSIVLYMETVGDARAFLSAARQVALDKPIIVLKAGRSPEGARAARLHTGAVPENDAVLEAAFRRAGALRVETVADLFEMAQVLAKQPRPRGPRLAILTNAGGPGVLAADALVTQGGALAELSPDTLAQLDHILPPHWSHSNPIDMLGDAGPELYARALEVVSQDSNTDGVLAILTPQATTDPTGSAEAIKPFAQMRIKPLFTAWMGGAEVEVGATVLRAASIPVFQYPDLAVRMFDYLVRYSENLRAMYETPAPPALEQTNPEAARQIIEHARRAGRTLLTEEESRQILTAYNIPFIETYLATSAAQAAKHSDTLGYPVVMKINTDRLIRKSEYGGVILNLPNAHNVQTTFRAVKRTITELVGATRFHGVWLQPMLNLKGGYALHVGSILDPQFGPVLRFGAEKRPSPADPRGVPITADATEMLARDARYRDDTLALPPLTTTLARRMMERTHVYDILNEANLDLSTLELVLTRFSTLVVEQPRIKAIDIHPLMVLPPSETNGTTQVMALDARIILHDPGVNDSDLPRPAIRPYPNHYVSSWVLDNNPIIIRPIRADDEPLLVRFHEQLSEQSVYMRYFHAFNLSQRIAHERLSRSASIDFARAIALVMEKSIAPLSHNGQNEPDREILAVGRLTRRRDSNDAEFAILIRDDYQKRGLGTVLLEKLIAVARAEGITNLVGEILPENRGMKRLAEKAGFTLTYDITEGVTHAELKVN